MNIRKPTNMRSISFIPESRKQQGISLFVVMVVVLLISLLVLWSSRTALLNERVTANDADYQRAFEAAQAMMEDAKLDILSSVSMTNAFRPQPRPVNVNLGATPPAVYLPLNNSLNDPDGGDLVAFIDLYTNATQINQCVAAICIGNDLTAPAFLTREFWLNSAQLDAMTPSGATYGLFTGQVAAAQGNPVLQANRAWYWIEVLPYIMSNNTKSVELSPRGSAVGGNVESIMYRVTAVARGLRPNTVAAIQSVVVPKASASVATNSP